MNFETLNYKSAKYYLLLTLATFFVFTLNSNYYISLSLGILNICILLLNYRLGVQFYLFLVLTSSDINLTPLLHSYGTPLISHSLELDVLLGTTMLTLLTIFIFLFSLLILPSYKNTLKINGNILFFIFLPLAIPIYGFLFNPLNNAFSDSAQFIAFFTGFLACYLAQLQTKAIINIIILAVLSTALFHIILSANHHFELIYYGYIGNLYPILIFFIEDMGKLLTLIFAILAALNLIIFPGRSRLLGYFYSAACKFYIKGSLKHWVILAIIITLIIVLIIYIAPLIPGATDYFLWKLTTIKANSYTAPSSYVRVIEFKNILLLDLTNIKNFFIGGGYGSCYSDTYYKFPSWILYNGNSNYPAIEISNDCFTKPHTNIAVIMLKSGMLLSLAFFVGNFIMIYVKLRNIIKGNNTLQIYKFLYYIPFWIIVAYNQSSFIIYGVFIYLLNKAYLENLNLRNNS